jgi:hypothetical protein
MAEATRGGTGSCLCEAVRYRYECEPTAIGLRQCERCQRQSGSAFSSAWSFQKEAVTIEGRLACYEATVSGQRLQRHFCPVCGSAVSITLDRYPEIRSMMACGSGRPSASSAPAASHGLNCRTASLAILNIPRERLAGCAYRKPKSGCIDDEARRG